MASQRSAILALKEAGASPDQITAAVYAMTSTVSKPPAGYVRVGTVADYVAQVIKGGK